MNVMVSGMVGSVRDPTGSPNLWASVSSVLL